MQSNQPNNSFIYQGGVSSPFSIILTAHGKRLKSQTQYLYCKRIFDIIVSAVALLFLFPLMLLLIILIKIDSPGNAIYRHWRIGKNRKVFGLYKFRTMVSDADDLSKYLSNSQLKLFYQNYKLENDPRITRIGKILRKTSMDELPQLFNILIGDMSFVGPRPLIKCELEENYGELAAKFCSIIPGLTGYWQANGRSDTTYKQRIDMEMFYVNNCSMILDMKIICKTIGAIIRRRGAL